MVLSADPSLQATAAELSVYMSALWRYEPGLYDLVASFIDFDALEKNNDDGGDAPFQKKNTPQKKVARWLKMAGTRTFRVLLLGANASKSPMSVNTKHYALAPGAGQ